MLTGKIRSTVRRLHLALALAFGAILACSGLTGCALVWMHELDSLLNPALFHVPSAAGSAPPSSTPAAVERLVERLQRDPAYGRPAFVSLPEHAGGVAVAWYRSPAGGNRNAFALDTARQVMVDPVGLTVTGERTWGEIGASRPLLMPTLYHLHRYLLAGETGKTVVGAAGLGLLLMTVLGLALWWPRASLAAWRRAFRIDWRGSRARCNYLAHRTAGALLAPVLAMLGFSGALFNLPQLVVPAIALVAPVAPAAPQEPAAAVPGRETVTVAQALRAAQDAFPAARISRIALPAKPGRPYEIRARQPGELRQGDGNTRLAVDAGTGKVVRVRDPLRASPGDAFLDVQFPLHTGEAFGPAGRWFMTFAGLAPLGFFVTGTAIWLRRRRSRVHRPAG